MPPPPLARCVGRAGDAAGPLDVTEAAGQWLKMSTLPELLRHAASRGLGTRYFHSGSKVDALPVTVLYSRALELSEQLASVGVGPGVRVGIVGLNCEQWAVWAWATWIAGAALVPLPAPMLVGELFAVQTTNLAEAAGCSMVVGARRYIDPLADAPLTLWDWGAPIPPWRSPVPAEERAVAPSDPAVVLCTSGSTAAPKAARMTHLGAVEWAATTGLRSSEKAVPARVNWFPYYHIAGLGSLFELMTPVDEHVLSIKDFLADPLSWLRLVSETRAAFAVSPSSTWSRVLDALVRDPAGIDLSHIEKVTFNAEMTDPDVLRRLRDVCGPLGLRPNTVAVVYASSEAGRITRTPSGEDPRVDTVDLGELLGSGRALVASPGHRSKRVVSCGRPYPGVEIRIGHPEGPLPDRQVGEVWVRGPGVTDGYLAAADEGSLVDGWLRTGDLAYLADGELWVTGRADDVVIVEGHKYHPEDIEWAVSRATGIAIGKCAAFSAGDGLFVVIEEGARHADLADRASTAVAGGIGIVPDEVLLVAPGAIPTTPNGKVQRQKLRAAWTNGILGQQQDGG